MEPTTISHPSRIYLTDGSKRFFYPGECRIYQEGVWWNGQEYISLATNNKVDHQELYQTPGNRFILRDYSDDLSFRDRYIEISIGEAIDWFAQNQLEPPPELAPFFGTLEIR